MNLMHFAFKNYIQSLALSHYLLDFSWISCSSVFTCFLSPTLVQLHSQHAAAREAGSPLLISFSVKAQGVMKA